MGWLRDMRDEWRARREGRRHLHNPIHHAARDITGPTGWVWSNAWDELDKSGDAYVASFDRRLPPSTFVSERDRQRANLVMPLAERCIEDWVTDHAAHPDQTDPPEHHDGPHPRRD